MLSCFTFIVGIIFMVFMMIAEDEPGALLLFLVFCGLSEMAANASQKEKIRNVKN